MSDKKQDALISVIGLRELRYIYLNPIEHFKVIKDQGLKTNLEMQLRYSWNIEDQRFHVLTKFLVFIANEFMNEKVVEFECSTDFKANNLNELVTQGDDGEFNINKDFEESAVRLAIAHGRAMFFQRTIPTIYRGIIYPLVDINKALLSNNPGGLKLASSNGEL